MMKQRQQSVFNKILLLAAILLAQGAWAQCNSQPNQGEWFFCPNDVTLTFSGVVQASGARDDLPQKMSQEKMDRDPRKFPFGQTTDVGLSLQMHLDPVGTFEGYGIYKLSEEIGVLLNIGDTKMAHDNRSKINLAKGVVKQLNFFPSNIPWYKSGNSLGYSSRAQIVLLKPIDAGRTITPPPKTRVATISMRRSPNNLWGKPNFDLYIDLSRATIRSQLRTCRMTSQPNITLQFPSVGVSSFPQVGNLVYGATTDITLDCNKAGNITVYAVLSDANNPSNRSDRLSIKQGTGKAKGVAIQVFKNQENSPVRYGPQSAEKKTENWWQLSSNNQDRNPKVKLTGYYLRTGKIRPGVVEGTATITFSYQ